MHDLSNAIDSDDNSEENVLDATPEGNKKRSMRAAINAYCKECTYDPVFRGGGTWREQVGACTITKCPLYEFRPVSRPKKSREDQLELELGDAEA